MMAFDSLSTVRDIFYEMHQSDLPNDEIIVVVVNDSRNASIGVQLCEFRPFLLLFHNLSSLVQTHMQASRVYLTLGKVKKDSLIGEPQFGQHHCHLPSCRELAAKSPNGSRLSPLGPTTVEYRVNCGLDMAIGV